MCETEGSSLISFRKHNSFISQIMQFALVLAVCSSGVSNLQAQDHAAEHHGGTSPDSAHAGDSHDISSGHSQEHVDDAAHHVDEGAGHGEHEKPTIWADLSFWSIIAFAGFCFAIAKLGLWDSLVTSMAAREKIENELISTAEAHLASAKTILNEYRGQLEAMDETVSEILAEANRDAAHTESEIIELANREAAQMLTRAGHEIERSKDQSLNDLFGHLAKRVTDAAEAKLRTELQSADQDKLIDETLGQLVAS